MEEIDTLNFSESFINIVKKFLNELELAFNYIGNEKLNELKKCITKMENDNEFLQKKMNDLIEQLQEYEDDLSLTVSNKKLKKNHLMFLEKICLFDILNFSLFKEENKNTKRTLVNYINDLYIIACFCTKINNENLNLEELQKNFEKFLSKDEIENSDLEIESSKKNNKKNKKNRHTTKNASFLNNFNGLPNMNNIGKMMNSPQGLQLNNIVKSLMNNSQIMDIAEDITNSITEDSINPANMLSSLMSGKIDPKLQKMVRNISSKIEEKFENGDLNKDELEEQANNVMSIMGKNNFGSIFSKKNFK